jgi:hypothetical protein
MPVFGCWFTGSVNVSEASTPQAVFCMHSITYHQFFGHELPRKSRTTMRVSNQRGTGGSFTTGSRFGISTLHRKRTDQGYLKEPEGARKNNGPGIRAFEWGNIIRGLEQLAHVLAFCRTCLRRSAGWCWGRMWGVTPSRDRRAGLETTRLQAPTVTIFCARCQT